MKDWVVTIVSIAAIVEINEISNIMTIGISVGVLSIMKAYAMPEVK
jgi:hypothetical protein